MENLQKKIDDELHEAMKSKNTVRTNALKNVKTKLIEFKTSVDGVKLCVSDEHGDKIVPDVNCISIIKKMVKELSNDIDIFKQNNRADLAEKAQEEMNEISVFIPEQASESDIKTVVDSWMKENGVTSIEKKQMGIVIKYVKSKLSNADGKTVSDIVRNIIG